MIRPVGQAVKTPPFHGGNSSSILLRVTKNKKRTQCVLFFVFHERSSDENSTIGAR